MLRGDRGVHGEAAEGAGITDRNNNIQEDFRQAQTAGTSTETTIRTAASCILVFEAGRTAKQQIAAMGASAN